jgi:TetR/AcrR family transcriptional regulator, regulator of autoinduction and epiphytic fitness
MRGMPRNHQHIDRAAKTARILDAAEELLLRDGYDATTMAAIARAAGVANNAVYWYFPGKDDLLAAVLERRLEQAATRADVETDQPLLARAMSALAELDAVSVLTSTVHERAKYSPAVASVHQAFHDILSERATEGLKSAGMSDDDARMAAAAVITVIEGIHLHEPARDPDSRNHLVGWLIQRLTATTGSHS